MVVRPSQSMATVQYGDSEDASRSLTIFPQRPGQRKLAHLRRRPDCVISRELSSTESRAREPGTNGGGQASGGPAAETVEEPQGLVG